MSDANLILTIDVPADFRYQNLLTYEGVPCICLVNTDGFRMSFVEPLPPMSGWVQGWQLAQLELRAPVPVGGGIFYRCNGQVSVQPLDSGRFRILSLSFFIQAYPGWFPILVDGTWCEPVCRHTAEELKLMAEIEAEFDGRGLRRKKGKM
ncbi:hypothetical protein [Roseateles sp. MS654]|uniref:hypothetical protein n=1 Tax=Roseateles sp. MS654 TaxID=3412685 RepID=UPI003C2D0B02